MGMAQADDAQVLRMNRTMQLGRFCDRALYRDTIMCLVRWLEATGPDYLGERAICAGDDAPCRVAGAPGFDQR